MILTAGSKKQGMVRGAASPVKLRRRLKNIGISTTKSTVFATLEAPEKLLRGLHVSSTQWSHPACLDGPWI